MFVGGPRDRSSVVLRQIICLRKMAVSGLQDCSGAILRLNNSTNMFTRLRGSFGKSSSESRKWLTESLGTFPEDETVLLDSEKLF